MPIGLMSNRAYFSVDSPILQIQISNAKNIPKDSSKIIYMHKIKLIKKKYKN